MDNPVAKALRDAADLIERTGWTRGALARGMSGKPAYTTSDGAFSFCALGALLRVTGCSRLFPRCVGAMDRRLGRSLVRWNDEQKSKRPVIAKLREVADALEAGHV